MAAGLGVEEVWPHCDCPRASPEAEPSAAELSPLPAPETPSEGPNSASPQTGDVL